MSLYTFATANFTTSDDRHRRPAVSTWQIARTLASILVVFLALMLVARHGNANPLEQPAPRIGAI